MYSFRNIGDTLPCLPTLKFADQGGLYMTRVRFSIGMKPLIIRLASIALFPVLILSGSLTSTIDSPDCASDYRCNSRCSASDRRRSAKSPRRRDVRVVRRGVRGRLSLLSRLWRTGAHPGCATVATLHVVRRGSRRRVAILQVVRGQSVVAGIAC